MPGIVLDTNVVCEPKRVWPDDNVVAWFERQSVDDLHLTSTVVGEIAFGIEIMPPGRRRSGFETWLRESVLGTFQGRILPFEEADALLYGRLMARARERGRPARVGDAEIAAVALRRGMTIATRNVAHFSVFAVPLIDPWVAPG